MEIFGIKNYYASEEIHGCNVMAEILLSRYDTLTSKKTQKHINTTLSTSEIDNIFGNRVRSRLRELYNLITFEEHAIDKRK